MGKLARPWELPACRFPFFTHLTLAEVAERDRLRAVPLRNMPVKLIVRLVDLNLRSLEPAQ